MPSPRGACPPVPRDGGAGAPADPSDSTARAGEVVGPESGNCGASRAGAEAPRDPAGRQPVLLVRAVLVLTLVVLATAVVAGVLVGGASPVGRAVGIAAVVALLAVQLRLTLRVSGRTPPRRLAVALLLQAGLVVVAAACTGAALPVLAGFVVGQLLLAVRLRTALGTGTALVAAAAAAEALHGSPPGAARLVLVATTAAAVGVVVAGVTRLSSLVSELVDARAGAADRATRRERARMARDVHDLLGLSLTAVTLKCELAARLLPPGADLSRDQLAEVQGIAQRALADVRAVSRGIERLSLDDELTLAADVLRAVDVRVRLQVDRPTPSGPTGSLLAAALREGVTNVLRHSDATQCGISVRRGAGHVALEITNDGLRLDPEREPAGQGLRNLRERVAAVGGAVVDGRDGPTHLLQVVLPRPVRASRRRARSGSRPHGSARRVS